MSRPENQSGQLSREPLLGTKLYAPAAREDLVSRPHLLERLGSGLGAKLTLVSAPAGFGKTSLISAWRMVSPGKETPLAWVSLDSQDNDPLRLWRYIVAALQTLQPQMSQAALLALSSPQPPPVEAILLEVLNSLAAFERHLVLILDDYHLIDNPAVHQSMSFFLEHLPPNTHLFVLGRSDPPLPLTRLRARAEMVEIRAEDLRFAHHEAATFLSRSFGLELSAAHLEALLERTEGWIASLRLAGLSLQGRKDIGSFIEAFAGSHRFIVDYLVEEVLERQAPEVRDFLLRTSILEYLCGPLCDAVTGHKDGQAMLEALERANLFMVMLDDERRWYRYHHLFADFLKTRLNQFYSTEVSELYNRAAGWLEHNGLGDAAIQQLLKAKDWDGAMRLIEVHADAKIVSTETLLLIDWLEALPQDRLRSNPLLCIKYAGVLAATSHLAQSQHWLEVAEGLTQGQPAWQGELLAIKAFVAGTQGNLTQAIQLSQLALEQLTPTQTVARFIALVSLVRANMAIGDPGATLSTMNQTRRFTQQSGFAGLSLRVTVFQGRQEYLLGQLQRASATFRQSLEVLVRTGGLYLAEMGLVYTGLGEIAYQQNHMDEARAHLQEGLNRAQRWVNEEYRAWASHILSGILWLEQDIDGARKVLQEAALSAEQAHNPLATALVGMAQAALALAEGDLETAQRWAQQSGITPDDSFPFLREPLYRLLARLLIAQDQTQEALGLIERLRLVAEKMGRVVHLMENLVLECLAHLKLGNATKARSILLRALNLGEPEGFVRVFADEGQVMASLLMGILEAQQRGEIPVGQKVSPKYIQTLLAAAQEMPGAKVPQQSEGLGERELRVLRLIAEGLSNKEIARRLELAPSTVKWYVNELFGKLEVKSRTQAIAKAHSLHLI